MPESGKRGAPGGGLPRSMGGVCASVSVGSVDGSARKDRWRVTDRRTTFFLGGVAETFLVGLAARVESGERAAAPLVFEAVRLLIAHAVEAYSEVIEYAQRTGLACAVTTGHMERKREALQQLDAVIVGLLRDRSAPITWPNGSAATESGREGVGG